MAQYISKSALVAEIEKRLHKERFLKKNVHDAYTFGLESVLKFLNTLEVKEVEEEPVSNDLEEASDKHLVEKGYLLTTNNGEHLAEVEAKGLFKAGAKWQKEQLIAKACVFLESTDFCKYYNREFIEEFKKQWRKKNVSRPSRVLPIC